MDTLAAGQAGAFALSENYLYTREAFTGYLNRLSPGGLLTLTRWIYQPPRQTLRVITIAAEALRSLGVRDPSQHIMAVADGRWNYSVFLISRAPLLPEDTARVLAACRTFGFVPLALPHVDVGRPGGNPFQDLLRTPDRAAFIASYPFDISVTTDDKPFFMEHTRWRNVLQHSDAIFNRASGRLLLLVTLGIVAVLALVFVLVPLVVANRRARGGAANGGALGYFACLGLGYVLVEIVLVQKFTLYLGNPSYSLSLVLCAMLTFSGLGSLASARLYDRGVRATSLVCAGIALTLAAYASFADPMLGATLGAGLPARIALTLLLLAVPGFLMGMPFPLGARRLGEGQRDRVVGGWVVNGYCSVLGSCLALVVSISGGLRLVLLAGAAAYFLAAALAGRTAPAPGGADSLPADASGSPRA